MSSILKVNIIITEKIGIQPSIFPQKVPSFPGETLAKGKIVLETLYTGSVNFMKKLNIKLFLLLVNRERITLPITSHIKSESV